MTATVLSVLTQIGPERSVARNPMKRAESSETDSTLVYRFDVSRYHPHHVAVEIRGTALSILAGELEPKVIVFETTLTAPFEIEMARAYIAGGMIEVVVPKANQLKRLFVHDKDREDETDATDDFEECDLD